MKKQQSGYFFGQTPYIAFPYSLNKLTHSKTRYALFRTLYDEEQDIQLGGVTTEWLCAAHEAMHKIEDSAKAITTPMLVFSADGDSIIDNKRQRRVVQNMPNAELEIVPRAYHELFTESDALREPTLIRLCDYLSHGLSNGA